MADNFFASPEHMLRRAKHHIEDLSTKINAFVSDKPWSRVVEKDADGKNDLHKIKFTKRLSEDLPTIVFDAANNLRSVLDQIAFAIAVKHTGNSSPKSAKFPIGPTESKMLDNAKGGCKDLPPEILSLFKSFKPYKGGNSTLWALNALANAPKHQTIVPVAIGASTSLRIIGQTITGGLKLPSSSWDPLKNEIIFLSSGQGSQFTYNANITFTVALDHVDDVI